MKDGMRRIYVFATHEDAKRFLMVRRLVGAVSKCKKLAKKP